MEVRGAGRKTTQDRPFDLADMVEFAVDQGLAEISSGLARASRETCARIRFAHRDGWQIADIKASQICGRVGGVGVAGTDVQGCREGMIAHVGRIVAGAASTLKRGNTAGKQATGRHIVVDARYARDVNGLGVENGLPARNCRPRMHGRQSCPGVKRVEDRGRKLTIARYNKPTRLLELGEKKVDAGVAADEERLVDERYGPATRPLGIQSGGAEAECLSGEQGHLKIHDLLLFLGGWPSPIA